MPVYNSEAFLEKCLHSLVSQKLQEIEIVIVNDGSTDNSDLIIQNFLRVDKRIKYINFPENRGTFYARMTGFLSSKGTFIGTVDSDDWVDETTFIKMYDLAVKENIDIVECRLWSVDSNFQRRTLSWADHRFHNFIGINILTNVLNRNIWHIAANKIFHRKLLEMNIEFYKSVNDKIVVADDKLITLPMFFYAESYKLIKERLYFYRYRDESASNNRVISHDFRHIQDTYNVDKHLNYFFEVQGNDQILQLFKKNSDHEIKLIFRNISTYPKSSCDRNYLYKAMLRIYKDKCLSVLHDDFELATYTKNTPIKINSLIEKLTWHFKIILKNIWLFLFQK